MTMTEVAGDGVVDRDAIGRAPAERQRRLGGSRATPASGVMRRGPSAGTAARRRPPAHRPGDDPAQPAGPDEILVRLQTCGRIADEPPATDAVVRAPAHRAREVAAAGTVIAAGDRVERFSVGDEVFGQFLTEPGVETPCARTPADGPHVERRPEALHPRAAAALAEGGLTAKTIQRAAELQSGQTALVVGATTTAGTVLVPVLAESGAHVIAAAKPEEADYVRSLGAADTIESTTSDPLADALASRPDVDLLVDLVSFGEPYFITAAARHGTIVTAGPHVYEPGIPRIWISAEPGDLASLARSALEGRQPAALAPPPAEPARPAGEAGRPTATPPAQPRA
jgi:NADPH:quinone reductase-like Zn-dependent oxidoreductase